MLPVNLSNSRSIHTVRDRSRCNASDPLPTARQVTGQYASTSSASKPYSASEDSAIHRAQSFVLACCCTVALTCAPVEGLLSANAAIAAEQAPTSKAEPITADAQQVKAALEALGLHPRTARALFRAAPEVLSLPTHQLKARAANIKSALKLDDKHFKQVILQAPCILTLEPKTLKDHLSRLQKLLSIDHNAAVKLAIDRPAVLLPSPNTLSEHLFFIQATLGFSPEAFKPIAASNPGLLLLTPATVTGRLEGLQATLGVGSDTAVLLAKRAPRLLLARMDSIEDRLKELANLFKVSEDTAQAWAVAQPRLLTISPSAALAPTMRQLCEALQISAEEAALAVRQAPALLLVSRDSARQAWGSAWEGVADLLGLPLDKAKAVLLKEPNLLAMTREQQKNRLEAVAEVFRLSDERVRELVAQRPELLGRSRADLELIRQQIVADMARKYVQKGSVMAE